MKPQEETAPVEGDPLASSGGNESEATGLPLLKTWPAVYVFVLGSFALWVILLFALSRMYE